MEHSTTRSVDGALARGAAVSLGGKFAGRFLGLVGDVLAARILGPAIFGLYGIGWTILRVIGLLVPLGLQSGVVRYVPRLLAEAPAQVRDLLVKSILASLLSGIAVGGLLYASSGWLAIAAFNKSELEPIFRLFAFAVPFTSLLVVAGAIARSRSDMRWAALFEDIGQPLAGLMLLVGFYLWRGASLTAVIFADVLSILLAALVGLWVVRRMFLRLLTPSRRDPTDFGAVLRYSVTTALAGVIAVLVFWVDRLLAGIYLPANQNGLYQAASQLSVVFVVILAAFNAIAAPLFSTSYTARDYRRLEETLRVGTRWGLYVSLPISLVICVIPGETLAAIYGAGYAAGAAALRCLAIGQLINIGTGSVGALLTMTGHQRTWLRLCVLALAVNLALCTILIPWLGIVGAAISTSIALGCMNIAGVIRARALLGVWPYDRRVVKGIGSAVIAALAVTAIAWAWNGSGLGLVLLGFFTASALFLLALMGLGLEPEDRHLLMTILSSGRGRQT